MAAANPLLKRLESKKGKGKEARKEGEGKRQPSLFGEYNREFGLVPSSKMINPVPTTLAIDIAYHYVVKGLAQSSCPNIHEAVLSHTGSGKTLGTILRDPFVPSSVGQVGLSGYSAFFSFQSAR